MKKALALILSLALAVSALTACGGASSSAAGSTSGSAPASAAPSGEKTVVTVWHMYAEDEEVTKPHQRLLQWAENYNATNTDNIEVVVSGAKTADVIMTTIASGSTPDIFQNYWNNAPTWANNGALYDLTEFVHHPIPDSLLSNKYIWTHSLFFFQIACHHKALFHLSFLHILNGSWSAFFVDFFAQ